MAKLFLTDTLIKTATCPEGKSQEIIHDTARGVDGKLRNGSIQGLGFRITAQGAKSFIHTFRFNGKSKRHVIGSPANMNVASARMIVQQRNLEIDEGNDPSLVKAIDYRAKHGDTLGEVIDAYFAQHLASRSASHRAEFGRLIAPWTRQQPANPKRGGKRKKRVTIGEALREIVATEITPQHIGPYLQSIQSNSVANSALRQLRALFNWSIRMQIVDMRNPCDPFPMRKIIKHRRDYTPDQIRVIAKHIFNPPMQEVINLEGLEGNAKRIAALKAGRAKTEYDQLVEYCNFMGILILTMARPSDVKNAQFDHFSLGDLIWKKHNTKGQKLSRSTYEYAFRSIPIHPKVAELVQLQRTRWPESDLLFPNHSDQTKPRDNFHRALQRFKALEGVPDYFQLYDLKRMAISIMMAGQGVQREAVSHLADHRGNIETTLIYDLGMVDPLRPVTEKLGKILGVA